MTPLARAVRAVAWEMSIPDEGLKKPERIARAVIEAIREPTHAMGMAWVGNSPGGSTPVRDWHAMIDALLEQGA